MRPKKTAAGAEPPSESDAKSALVEQLKPLKNTVGQLSGSLRKIEQSLETVLSIFALIEQMGGIGKMNALLQEFSGARGTGTPLERIKRIVRLLENMDYQKVHQWLDHPIVHKLLSVQPSQAEENKADDQSRFGGRKK